MLELKKYLHIILLISFFYSAYSQSDSSVVVNSIKIEGNKTTKEAYILREILLEKSDTIEKKNLKLILKHSKQNLINTSLFNFVYIDYQIDTGLCDISIKVDERWYWWTYPILENADRNFNSLIDSKDWSRINYGVYFEKQNFRGRNERLKFKARFGYKEQFAFSYSKPYINKAKNLGIYFSISYFRQKQKDYNIRNNKLSYLQSTKYIYKYLQNNLTISYKPKYYFTHFLSFAHNNFSVSDSLITLNNNFFYDNRNKMQYIRFGYNFAYNNTNYRYYPTTGNSIGLTANYYNLLDNKNNFASASFAFKNYKQIKNSRFYFANGFVANRLFAPIKNSHILSTKLGYSNFVRGYELSVINVTEYYLLKNELKYKIIKYKEKQLNFIPLSKFKKLHYTVFLKTFIDYAYSKYSWHDDTNDLENEQLLGYGIGLDFITYYDIILRFELSANRHKDFGFFFHFVAGI